MNKFQIYNKALPACHTSDRCGTCQCTNNTQLATKYKQKHKMKQFLSLCVTATSPINLTHQKEKSKIEYLELVQGDRTSIAVIRRSFTLGAGKRKRKQQKKINGIVTFTSYSKISQALTQWNSASANYPSSQHTGHRIDPFGGCTDTEISVVKSGRACRYSGAYQKNQDHSITLL
ncbi:hypothetical protein MTR_4g071455 [Medicago truncatula]|uniref:Uncharacterized protein n=1 Tax=Medicago truncatula TaxID=3880 RepID=A0A072UM61_MEDTR|nr:hypothetical protein MTR_4g071455 [Medicago truncatula]